VVPADGGEELPAALVELLELDPDAEQKLLEEILERGWDQGCLLSLPLESEPSSFSPAHVKDLTGRLATREAAYPAVPDPFEGEPLACGDPGDLTEGYLVLTQRCDLIKGIATEPFVAIGRAFRSSDPALNSSARARTSATHLHLSDAADGEAWLLDLRAQWQVPKTWLSEAEPIHLIEPGLPRRRFARGLGNRSARAPVPTEIVDGLQRPLRDWLYQSAGRRGLCEPFCDLLLLQTPGGEWALLGVYDTDVDAELATEKFDGLFGAIRGKVPSFPLSEEDSDAIRIDQISAADFLSAHRLDLDKVSLGSKSAAGSQAEPRL
jgi:hypothetical protein